MTGSTCVPVPDSQIDYLDRTIYPHCPDVVIKFSMPNDPQVYWRPSSIYVVPGSINVNVILLDWNGHYLTYANIPPGCCLPRFFATGFLPSSARRAEGFPALGRPGATREVVRQFGRRLKTACAGRLD